MIRCLCYLRVLSRSAQDRCSPRQPAEQAPPPPMLLPIDCCHLARLSAQVPPDSPSVHAPIHPPNQHVAPVEPDGQSLRGCSAHSLDVTCFDIEGDWQTSTGYCKHQLHFKEAICSACQSSKDMQSLITTWGANKCAYFDSVGVITSSELDTWSG